MDQKGTAAPDVPEIREREEDGGQEPRGSRLLQVTRRAKPKALSGCLQPCKSHAQPNPIQVTLANPIPSQSNPIPTQSNPDPTQGQANLQSTNAIDWEERGTALRPHRSQREHAG